MNDLTVAIRHYMNPSEDGELVTLGWIAQYAVVGASTVSNWRKRDKDTFPEQVAGTVSRPLFRRADVVAWLKDSGRLDEDTMPSDTPRAKASSLINRLRRRVGAKDMLDVLAPAIAHLHAERISVPLPEILQVPPSGYDEDFASIVELIGGEVAPDEDLARLLEAVFDHTKGRASTRAMHGGSLLSPGLIEVLAKSDAGGVVFDPLVGGGELAIALARATAAQHVVGYDLDHAALRLFAARAVLAGLQPRAVPTDSASDLPATSLVADTVVIDRPRGRYRGSGADIDPGLRAKGISPSAGDLYWAQIAIAYLAESGTAYVAMPSSAAITRRDDRVRDDLIASGALVAIISLPPGAVPAVSGGTDLWVLRAPTPSPSDTVRLIDARAINPRLDAEALREALWSHDIESDLDFVAVDVRRLDLLRSGADLSPARWLSKQYSLKDAERNVAQFSETASGVFRELERLSSRSSSGIPRASESGCSFVTIEQLQREKRATIIRRQPTMDRWRELRQQYGDLRIDLPESATTLRYQLAPQERDRMLASLPKAVRGDILVIETDTDVFATVADGSERDPVFANVAVRLSTDELLPSFVALCFRSSQARAFIDDSGSPRFELESFRIPILPIAEQAQAVAEAESTESTVRQLETLATRLRDAQQQLTDAIAAGFATFDR